MPPKQKGKKDKKDSGAKKCSSCGKDSCKGNCGKQTKGEFNVGAILDKK